MESQVSEILENVLGLLGMEGSFEIEEKDEGFFVSIETPEAGRLIGFQGETLSALQLVINMIFSKQNPDGSKRIILDVSNWRKAKEDDLSRKAKSWADQVIESKKDLELDPMPAWQRRIIHLTIENTDGVTSESIGEGPERRLVIKPS